MPYFREEDFPEPTCDGSYKDLGWEGRWDDPSRPKEVTCPACGIKMKPEFDEYLFDSKKDVFFASVPRHYVGETPEFYRLLHEA